MARGELVLFTGAGFSRGARNVSGHEVPLPRDLRKMLWELVYPGEPADEASTLQEVFGVALARERSALDELLRRSLKVDPASFTETKLLWLSAPWRRAYTVNIDDLEMAGSSRLATDRAIRSVSALRDDSLAEDEQDLLFYHLNGDMQDVPDVTFSERQFAGRLATEDVAYSRLLADLNYSPVVFVGTSLQESPFWRYVELRQRAVGSAGASRPLSYLVAPQLSVARREMLGEYEIQWLQADAAEFGERVLARLTEEMAAGQRVAARRRHGSYDLGLADVAERVREAHAAGPSDYLEGADPTWGDVVAGRTIRRQFEGAFDLDFKRGQLLVTGTAGAGTTSTLMRVAAALAAAGREVLWLSAKAGVPGQRLRTVLRTKRAAYVLAIDDADMLGMHLEHLLHDVEQEQHDVLVLMGMRSARVDAALPDWSPVDHDHQQELSVPPLGDADIANLLAALEKDRKLRLLEPLTYDERVAVFKEQAGRQLLVAMIRATERRSLEEKAEDEYSLLPQPQRQIYGAIALATAHRYGLGRDEALQAASALTPSGADAVALLVARGLVIETDEGYQSRHRLIAELVYKRMKRDGTLPQLYTNVAAAIAVRHQPADLRGSSYRHASTRYQFTQRLMNHREVEDVFAFDAGQRLYQQLEAYLHDDYHFWLQRGSYEVRGENMERARRYLLQARTQGGDRDFRVDVEWAYCQLKAAWLAPRDEAAETLARDGKTRLLHLIDTRGSRNGYPYHVLLSQYPRWLAAAPLAPAALKREYEELRRIGDRAVEVHGDEAGMRGLRQALERQYLSIAVPANLRKGPWGDKSGRGGKGKSSKKQRRR